MPIRDHDRQAGAGGGGDVAADDGKGDQAERVQPQEDGLQALQAARQEGGADRGPGRKQQVFRMRHPTEGIVAKDQVADGAAAGRGHGADHAQPEQVHAPPHAHQRPGSGFGRDGDEVDDMQHGASDSQ